MMEAMERREEAMERREWGAYAPSSYPGWSGDQYGAPLSEEQARRIDDERAEALMRVEAGLCPACGNQVDVVDGWARCPNRGPARPGGQRAVEFQLRSVDGEARIVYRLTGEWAPQ